MSNKHKHKHKHNKHNKNSIGSKLSTWKNDFIYTLKHTSAEIFIGSALFGIGAGLVSYDHESDKNKKLRLGFSEIESIERHAKFDNVNVPNMTEFLAKSNDFYMKVFESHNNSWDAAFLVDNTKKFSSELEYHVDMTFKQHKYEFPQLSNQIPRLADSLLSELSYLKKMKEKSDNLSENLENTWDDSHHDNLTLQPVVGYKGKISMQLKYSSTDNKYVYYNDVGEQSSKLLNEFKNKFPTIKVDELFVKATETNAENEYAIDKTQREDFDHKLTIEDYLKISNSWVEGSDPYIDFKNLINLQTELHNDSYKWNKDKNTAKSYSKRTYNHSHAASEEFLTAENAKSHSQDFSRNIEDMITVITKIRDDVPITMDLIKEFIDKSHIQSEKSNAEDLKDKIMSQSLDNYKVLFPKGINVERAEWGYVWLWTVLGLVGGGLLGAAIDKYTGINNSYDRFLKNKDRDD